MNSGAFRSAGVGGDGSWRGLRGLVAGLLATTALCAPGYADTLPTGGQVTAGTGNISQSGGNMVIDQGTQNLAIDWQSFSIGRNNAVTFNQPSSSSVALNRVLGSDPSVIQGALNANGHVFLVNPNGVLFSTTAQVNVGGLVASTLDIDTGDFLAGDRGFSGDSPHAVINQGNIQAAPGGQVAFIAAQIVNTGTIEAERGNVLMGAGSKVTLDIGGPVAIEVEQGAIDALVAQGGAIRADGGLVYIAAQAVGDLAATVINNTGIVQARTLATGENGQIMLMGGMTGGQGIVVGGTLDASAPHGGAGGFIETSAAQVAVVEGATVRAGHWLIDPTDLLVDAAMADAIEGQLTVGDASIVTSADGDEEGHIAIEAPIAYDGNLLTISAHGDIYFRANINGTGTASLLLEFGQSTTDGGDFNYRLARGTRIDLPSGNTFSTQAGTDAGNRTDFQVITTQDGLQAIDSGFVSRNGDYALGSDITMVGEFSSIGGLLTPFTGTFHGLGHEISDLTISGSSSNLFHNYHGLFGHAFNAIIRDVGLVDPDVAGRNFVGALVGAATGTTSIASSYVTGGTIEGRDDVGGLVGYGGGWTTITLSFADDVDVFGSSYVGGLVGYFDGLTIDQSYASGTVTAEGGLLLGGEYAGGLVGYLDGDLLSLFGGGTIRDSYATAEVIGRRHVGGLVGRAWGTYTLENTYASGPVTATSRLLPNAGGLIGSSGGLGRTVVSSYWDVETTGQNSSANSSGSNRELPRTTEQMEQQATFVGWDFDNVWRIYEGESSPVLRSLQQNLIVSADDQQMIYNGADFDGRYTATFSIPDATPGGDLVFGGDSQTAVNAGSYVITASGLQSSQGFNVIFVDGTLDITRRVVTLNGSFTAANKAFDGNTSATVNLASLGLTGLVDGENLSLAGLTGNFATPAVGIDKKVSLSGGLANGTDGLASNYTLSFDGAPTAKANITAVPDSGLREFTPAVGTAQNTTTNTTPGTGTGSGTGNPDNNTTPNGDSGGLNYVDQSGEGGSGEGNDGGEGGGVGSVGGGGGGFMNIFVVDGGTNVPGGAQ